MVLKYRIIVWTTTITIIVALLMGLWSLGVFAAVPNTEYTVEDVYLPLVMLSEPPTPTPLPTIIPDPIDPPEKNFEEQVVTLTNQERSAHGCDSVTMDSRLKSAGEGHSRDMALNDFFSHYAPDGTSPWERIRAEGYNYSLAGENIAAGYSSPESVIAGWMNSKGHRDNILNCDFVHIGVGFFCLQNDPGKINYRYYWTQVFASP